MSNQPKISIYSRIQNPDDYKIQNTKEHTKGILHDQTGESIELFIPHEVTIQFAADIITAALTKNKGDLDLIRQDLEVLNRRLAS
jgi:hypothetical protein